MRGSALLMSAALCASVTLFCPARVAAEDTRRLEITFVASSQGAPFVFDEFAYSDPVGGEPVMFRDIRFYASGLKLRNATEEFAEADSYHLVRFDARSPTDKVVLDNVPLGEIDEIEMSIGLDPEANGSIMPRGDLDPNSRMAWNWEIGYKFLLAEGALMVGDKLEPLVYHVGFNESLRTLRLPVSIGKEDMSLTLDVDVLALFAGVNTIDMSALPTIKMNRADASMLADNFTTFVNVRSDEARD